MVRCVKKKIKSVRFLVFRCLLRLSSARLRKVFCLEPKTKGQNLQNTQFFSVRLLMPMHLADQLYFQLIKTLTKSMAVGKSVSNGDGFVIGFPKCFLWKISSNFQRYCVAKAGSQVVYSSGQLFHKIKQQRPNKCPISDYFAQTSLS